MPSFYSRNPQDVIRYSSCLAKNYSATLDELSIWKYRVHSTMFIASATILTLACSLGSPISGTPNGISTHFPDYTYWISTATISLNGICLLALLLSLYQNIHATRLAKDNIEKRFEALKVHLAVPTDGVVRVGDEYEIVLSVGKSWFFSVCELVAYISFVLMVAGLILRYCFM